MTEYAQQTELTPYARLHVYGLKGHNPITAFETDRGGVWVFRDALEIRIKAVAGATVLASGGPEKFLKEFWPEAEFEFPPFADGWVSQRSVAIDEDASGLTVDTQ
jgi:hypothetical protein